MPPVVASTYGRFSIFLSLVIIVIFSNDKKGSETQLFSEPYLCTPSGVQIDIDNQYIICEVSIWYHYHKYSTIFQFLPHHLIIS